MGMVFGRTGVKEPSYSVLKSFGNFEVRKYPAVLTASVVTNDPTNSKAVEANQAFRVLAKYIGVFGKPENRRNEAMAMTAPVIMDASGAGSQSRSGEGGEAIAMTAPVISKSGTMAFVMPFEYTMETLPVPTDDRVTLKKVSAKIIAVKQFSGWYSAELGKTMHTELMDDLQQSGLSNSVASSSNGEQSDENTFTVSQYNPPFTLGPFRRNEIWVDLSESGQAVQNLLVSNTATEQ